MLLRALVSLGLVATVTMGCSPPASEIAQTNDADLIGGDYLTDGDLPSTLHVGGCTAAKVGPRHVLLAAHCVWDGGLREDFADGKPIRVTNAVSVSQAATEFQVLTIKHVTYDAEKHIVTGVGNSVWCGLFSGRE